MTDPYRYAYDPCFCARAARRSTLSRPVRSKRRKRELIRGAKHFVLFLRLSYLDLLNFVFTNKLLYFKSLCCLGLGSEV